MPRERDVSVVAALKAATIMMPTTLRNNLSTAQMEQDSQHSEKTTLKASAQTVSDQVTSLCQLY